MVNKELLRRKMRGAGYTQASLADEANMSRTALSYKINGKSQFTLGEVETICNILHIDAKTVCLIFLC